MNKLSVVTAALFALSSATICTAQVDPKWEIHDRNRPVPAVSHARHCQHPRRARQAALRRHRSLRRKRSLAVGSEKRRQPRQMESRKRLLRSRRQNRRHAHQGLFRRLPAARRILRTRSSQGRRSGPRQQRRFSDGALRNSGSRFLQQQNLRRRPGLRGLRPISAAGQRFARARPMADLRHHLARPALRCRRQSSLAPRTSPSSTTASSRKTTSNSPAPPAITFARRTRPLQKNCRSRCRITIIRSATATSGSANCRLRSRMGSDSDERTRANQEVSCQPTGAKTE